MSEQGHFDELAASGGYVSSFDLGQPDWNYIPDQTSYHVPTVIEQKKVIQTDDDLEAEANRATGDFTIYQYYFASVGWLGILVFLTCISGFVFCISFPSKFAPVYSWRDRNTNRAVRYLGQMVGCLQLPISIREVGILYRNICNAWCTCSYHIMCQLLVRSHSIF